MVWRAKRHLLMPRAGAHALLMVAAIAAISLHAILLAFKISTETPQSSMHTIQISLLEAVKPTTKQQHRSSERHRPKAHTTSTNSNRHKAVERQHIMQTTTATQTQPKPAKVRQQLAIHQPLPTPRQITTTHKPASPAQQPTPSSNTQDHAIQAQATAATQNLSVPEAAKVQIMTHIHYPRQAQRHGWQGKVEMQFMVIQQSIQQLTLLASSGHPILDRAAYRGLSHLDHISLPNGRYHMPIFFRLQ